MMQIKFNFNNFIIHGVSATAWQRAGGIRRRRWRLWLAYPIMTWFRYVPYVACVALDGNPALRACVFSSFFSNVHYNTMVCMCVCMCVCQTQSSYSFVVPITTMSSRIGGCIVTTPAYTSTVSSLYELNRPTTDFFILCVWLSAAFLKVTIKNSSITYEPILLAFSAERAVAETTID